MAESKLFSYTVVFPQAIIMPQSKILFLHIKTFACNSLTSNEVIVEFREACT